MPEFVVTKVFNRWLELITVEERVSVHVATMEINGSHSCLGSSVLQRIGSILGTLFEAEATEKIR